MPDVRSIEPFLSDGHAAVAAGIDRFAAEALDGRPAAENDEAARVEARHVLGQLGAAGWGAYALVGTAAERDLRAACLIREGLAWSSPLADAVFALQALGGRPLVEGASQGLAERWLSGIADGSVMAAFAMTEPEAGSDVGAIRTRARRDGDGWVLDGGKWLISNAGIADVYAVFASTDPEAGTRGLSCFLVPADTEGLRFKRAQVLSAPHPLGEIEFSSCRVPADHLLGEEGRGFALGMATLDRLRVTVAAAACGMASRALAEARRHAAERRQFDRPLGDFQLVQASLADMATELEAARLLTYRAAWESDLERDEVSLRSAMAKLTATETTQKVVDRAVQILGGRGVLADSPVDHLYRSVRALRIYEGASDIQRLVIARKLPAR